MYELGKKKIIKRISIESIKANKKIKKKKLFVLTIILLAYFHCIFISKIRTHMRILSLMVTKRWWWWWWWRVFFNCIAQHGIYIQVVLSVIVGTSSYLSVSTEEKKMYIHIKQSSSHIMHRLYLLHILHMFCLGFKYLCFYVW